MAAFVFNIAKGRVAHLGTLPAANDGLVALLLVTAGLEADATLKDHDNVSTLLLGTSDEATFTGYARRTLTGVTVTVDDTADTVSVTGTIAAWSPTTSQALSRIVIAYDADLAAGTDVDLIPLVADDFVVTTATSGTLAYTTNAAGFFGAS